MGMYTELVLKCSIKRDTPEAVVAVLEYMFGDKHSDDNNNYVGELPDHEFFRKPRWSMIGKCSSFYHHPEAVSSLYYTSEFNNESKLEYIFSRSDFKNYAGELEAFIDWLTPYVEGSGKICIGHSWYEEADEPTPIIVTALEQANG